ncbi:serine kinase [Paraburkholderia sp. Ac-20336]|uniref:serine kinase n=1 Tax=Paraburkholderia sp. Ac-20336 TaxID=2703886 RepID=UPI00197CBE0A|nr:serine kinase [Paraburkholderia sp. Ac-20336]MBN3807423.1 serine kinase [Paraburkholderia sp. Ac-20336]
MSMITAAQFQHELSHLTEATAPQPAAAPQALVDKFQAMMANPTPNAVPEVHQIGHTDIVTKAVKEQADYYHAVPNDVLYMSQHASTLSMQHLASADMTVQLEIASLNMDLQVKMATVQSSKDAVQTLMKNQ